MSNQTIIQKIISIFLLFFLLFSQSVLGYSTSFIWSSEEAESIETSVTEQETVTNTIDLKLESGGAILIEQNSGKVLYDHNMHEKLRPASVTKVMTILLIMEALDSGTITLQDKVPCSETAASMGGSQIWLDVKEELTVDEMLKAICVVSANDCTVAMAEYLSGSQEAFVEKMNLRAKELGMLDTTFKNCHGIDEDGHVTSAYDIALMSRELLKNHPAITKYTTIWIDSLRDGKSELVNTNKLIRNYQGATGLKTGSTSVALYNLSASATRNDLSLIAVVLKAPTTKIRFSEAQKLLDYGFSNYIYQSFNKKGETIKTIDVKKGVMGKADVIFKEDSGTLIKKGQEKQITQNIVLEEKVTAPVAKGQRLGEIQYILDGELLSSTELIAAQDVPKKTLMNMACYLYKDWFCLLRK